MDIIPSRRSRTLIWVATFVACLMVIGTGAAAAAVRYEESRSREILPGVTIGGVDLSGMSLERARMELRSRFELPLSRPLSVEAGGVQFTPTLEELGASTDALQKLEEVTSEMRSLPVRVRLWHRITRRPLAREVEVTRSIDSSKLEKYLGKMAEQANRAAQEASLKYVDGDIVVHEAASGFVLDPDASEKALRLALVGGVASVKLPGDTLEPPENIDRENVIVVRLGAQVLEHYRNGALVKSYTIIHGGSVYPTPTGSFPISAKRVNPVWRNPAKYAGGWGEHLPAVIGPGWGNPLGTRALNLGSTLIRIHGTYKPLSANESRGCIRMRIPDSEELFERVNLGTMVFVVP